MNALLYPSPNDANLRTSGDPLAMLSRGSYDLNRFYLFNGKASHIDNRTSDIFNHTRSTGGYNNDGTTYIPNKVINPIQDVGGVIPFPTLPITQSIANEITNNPYPVRNALVAKPPVEPSILHENPPQINPIAIQTYS